MEQLTTEQAIAFHDSGAWQKWDAKTRALFQMEQACLCMPFGEFHKAVEDALGRPVWTHEFGLNRDGLLAELQGNCAQLRGHPGAVARRENGGGDSLTPNVGVKARP